jgi:ATP-dependent RNA helicase DDX27
MQTLTSTLPTSSPRHRLRKTRSVVLLWAPTEQYVPLLKHAQALLTHLKSGVSIDDIIARRRLTNATRKRKVADVEESASEKESEDESDSAGSAEDDGWSDVDDEDEPKPSLDQEEDEDEDDPLASSDEDDDRVVIDEDDEDAGGSSGDESDMETQAERDRKAAFFGDSSDLPSTQSSFVAMNLSRPILKALTSLGFNTPTPIQAATIPVALLGKDVVGNAVTGSGKTAAFIIPMIERLLHREKGRKAAATRCLVLVPTRELGVQCFEVGKKLSAHTDIQFCLAVGK